MSVCPTCGGTGRVHTPFNLDAATRELEQRCRERGLLVAFDLTVCERTAAKIIGREQTTLRNWRSAGAQLRSRKVGGRVRYALRDLAEFLRGE